MIDSRKLEWHLTQSDNDHSEIIRAILETNRTRVYASNCAKLIFAIQFAIIFFIV